MTIKEIAADFKDFIAGKSFGFSENHSSSDEKIIRYREGIEKISELMGVSIEDLESESEVVEDKDNGIIDVRFTFKDIAFEYSFPADEENEEDEIDEESGWWKVWYINGFSYDDIDLLIDGD